MLKLARIVKNDFQFYFNLIIKVKILLVYIDFIFMHTKVGNCIKCILYTTFIITRRKRKQKAIEIF